MKIFLTLLLVLILTMSLSLSLDESAMKIHDAAFERAMVAFGLAKGLNGIISLIQGTELSFAPVGIGLTFSIGEVLDPFNDMVERFSWVMLFATVSLGIQKLLLVLSVKLFLQAALIVSVGVTLLFIWIKKMQHSVFLGFSFKVLILLFLLRFGAILFVYSSEFLYNSLLQTQYQSSSVVIEKTMTQLEEIEHKNKTIVENKKESGIFGSMSSKYNEIMESFNISKELEALSNNIEDASRNIIHLITIFIVQSVVMPLLFLWFLLSAVRWLFRTKFDNQKIVYNFLQTQP